MKLKQSERKNTKIKLGLLGASGSGKTMSALLMSYGITGDWNKIAVIDTESSANLYAHLGNYQVLSLAAPYTPENYIKAIELCEQSSIEVIIIDSISHSWDFLLGYHAALTGNSFVNWGKITPRYNSLIQKIQQSNLHIICTMRTKQDYTMSEKNGKFIPEKNGTKAVMRDGVEYEFTIVMNMDLNHQARVTKDRTGIFKNLGMFIPSVDTGKSILLWCSNDTKVIEMNNLKLNQNGSVTSYAQSC